jgi:2-keto-myo-inositol isomerase
MFPFKMALNASTLFPFKLDVKQQMQIAARAGYEGIELWVRDLEGYRANGGRLRDLKQESEQYHLPIVNAISFIKWADADESVRTQAMIQAEQEMRMLASLGCRAIAAPPFGNVEGVALESIAQAFARLVELGRSIGVEPYLEFWGRARTLSTLNEARSIAARSGVPDAKFLLDPFHMYTGGSDFADLAQLTGTQIGIVHVNDYPAEPGRESIQDKDRVFPGEGIAPCATIAQLLYQAGYRDFLSLELFIPDFGSRSALEVAQSGLSRSRSAFSFEI